MEALRPNKSRMNHIRLFPKRFLFFGGQERGLHWDNATIPHPALKEKTMPELKWNPTLEIGYEAIDSQHRTMVDLVNQLQRAMEVPQCSGELQAIFNQLESYTLYHFQEEEKIMRQIGFEFYETHVAEHDFMREKVAEFHDAFDNQEVDIGKLISFLTGWLINHICGSDSLIGESIRRKQNSLAVAA